MAAVYLAILFLSVDVYTLPPICVRLHNNIFLSITPLSSRSNGCSFFHFLRIFSFQFFFRKNHRPLSQIFYSKSINNVNKTEKKHHCSKVQASDFGQESDKFCGGYVTLTPPPPSCLSPLYAYRPDSVLLALLINADCVLLLVEARIVSAATATDEIRRRDYREIIAAFNCCFLSTVNSPIKRTVFHRQPCNPVEAKPHITTEPPTAVTESPIAACMDSCFFFSKPTTAKTLSHSEKRQERFFLKFLHLSFHLRFLFSPE